VNGIEKGIQCQPRHGFVDCSSELSPKPGPAISFQPTSVRSAAEAGRLGVKSGLRVSVHLMPSRSTHRVGWESACAFAAPMGLAPPERESMALILPQILVHKPGIDFGDAEPDGHQKITS
jgi:hypothetical protein